MDKIKDALKCSICKNVLNTPVLLPCEHLICKKHLDDEIIVTEGRILCNECGQDHLKQEFPAIPALTKIIEAQIANMDLGPLHKTAKDSCDKLETVIKQCDQLLKDPEYFTHEEINELQRQLQLKCEELKKQIDDEFGKFYTKLEDYKLRCKNQLVTNEYKFRAEKIEEDVKPVRNELIEWKQVLNELKISNEPKWVAIKAESDKSIGELEAKIRHFKHELLLKKFAESKTEVEWLKNIKINSAFEYFW